MITKFEGVSLVDVKGEKIPSVFVNKCRIRESFKKIMCLEYRSGSLQSSLGIHFCFTKLSFLFQRHYKQKRVSGQRYSTSLITIMQIINTV